MGVRAEFSERQNLPVGGRKQKLAGTLIPVWFLAPMHVRGTGLLHACLEVFLVLRTGCAFSWSGASLYLFPASLSFPYTLDISLACARHVYIHEVYVLCVCITITKGINIYWDVFKKAHQNKQKTRLKKVNNCYFGIWDDFYFFFFPILFTIYYIVLSFLQHLEQK